jgi:hypothetical protein
VDVEDALVLPARTGLGEPVNGVENLHCDLLRDGANVGFGWLRTCSFVSPSSALLPPGGYPVVVEPLFGSGHGALLLFGDRFIVDGSIADGDDLGIGHDFEQPNHGVQLTWIELIEQLMGMLFVHMLFPLMRSPSGAALGVRSGSFKKRVDGAQQRRLPGGGECLYLFQTP